MADPAPKGAALRWLNERVHSECDDCSIWPFKSRYTNGYGAVWFRGRLTGAHRVACTLAHGEPREKDHAAHSCGRADCCNPRHLRWATCKENHADKNIHGTSNIGARNGNALLSDGQVRVIKARLGAGELHREIANDFGVTREAISSIAQGKNWKHIKEIENGK